MILGEQAIGKIVVVVLECCGKYLFRAQALELWLVLGGQCVLLGTLLQQLRVLLAGGALHRLGRHQLGHGRDTAYVHTFARGQRLGHQRPHGQRGGRATQQATKRGEELGLKGHAVIIPA